ncbi:hypothetical protein BGO18_01595 [Candidatus Saccharibacteria bacterium 47-87]|jgi:hypothetical protein|nr:hypothetical protein [Candidatus Saccharibacteria bacterium]OJU96863.1 MAG: hypothetical protein BGO18_01595 [Candidatus Saccharibacteria bacterium 47-87]
MNASVSLADVVIVLLALLVMITPWLPSKGRFIASVLSVVTVGALILWCDNATWIHWVEFLRTCWYALLVPFFVFLVGIFASKSK